MTSKVNKSTKSTKNTKNTKTKSNTSTSVLKPEKNIYERISKKRGPYLQVKIQVSDCMTGSKRMKEFGRFFYSDYPTNKMCMQQAIKCRNEAVELLRMGNFAFSDCTVDDCYQSSLELLVTSVKTKKKHDGVYKYLVPDKLKNKKIIDVTTEEVQRTMTKFAKDHSIGTLHLAKTIWHQIYVAAAMKELSVIDRSMLIQMPKSKTPTKSRNIRCTHEELNQFLDALAQYGDNNTKTRHRANDLWYAIQIMNAEGLRPQEVFALHKSDIDLEENEMTICHSIGSDSEGTRKFITTKNEESIRTIPIASDIVEILKEKISNTPKKQDALFLDSDAEPYEIDILCMLMRNVSKKLNVPRITLYMCRHLFATEMYNGSTNKKAVQKIMGHTSETTTLGYVTTSEEEIKNALENRKVMS